MVMAVLALGLCQYWLLFRLELLLDSKTARLNRTGCACYSAMSCHPSFFSTLWYSNEEVQAISMVVYTQGQQQHSL